jgi:hypothetical protein
VERCSASYRLFAPTRYAGLRAWTTPARRSKSSIHVMAEEPVPFPNFYIDRSNRRAYVFEISPVPLRTPLRSRIRRGAPQPPPSGQGCSIPHNKLDRSRESQLARSPRLAQVTRIAVGVTPTAALIDLSAPAHPARRSAQSSTNTNRHHNVARALMEFIERTDVGAEPIPIAHCRELLGQEADALTDQEVAAIRRHAETMAWILLEMYANGGQLSE